MRDFLLIAVILSACTAIGYPVCLLIPVDHLKARFVAAPTIGFSVLSTAAIALYTCGVSPRITLIAVSAGGLLASAVHIFGGRRATSPSLWSPLGFGIATLGVVLLCLLPAWTGGPQFTVFQGNVFDQVNMYLPGSVVFHQYDYASVLASVQGEVDNPILGAAKGALNRPISIIHAAFSGMTHSNTPSSSYAFMVALQLNIFFSALFVALNVFEANYRISIVMSAALTVGFFEQYVFDIDAWSQLATQPIYLMILAVVVLAFHPDRFGAMPVGATARIAALFGVLMTSVALLYPDSAAIYGVAGATAAAVGIMSARSHKTRIVALTGLSLGTTGALALSWWYGTIAFLFGKVMNEALRDLDWWKYFQRYLFGREQDYLAPLIGGADASWSMYLNALFSLPVESAIAGIGLYYFLPTVGWPWPLAILWKLILYVLVAVVFVSVARVIMMAWRQDPASNQTRMLGACVAGCLVPIAIFIAGRYWSAGKALSIAAPLLFLLIAAPLLTVGWVRPLGRIACLLVLVGHLTVGALRPVMAAHPGGTWMSGLPGSAPAVQQQKAGMDWQVDRWAALYRACRRIILDVDHPFMNRLAQLVATDIGLPWASVRPINWGFAETPAYQPPGWREADCIATDRVGLHVGRRVIWLIADRTVVDFLEARAGILEIGVEGHPGITVEGAHALESLPQGPLRWTSAITRFELANVRDAPATNLVLRLWPMPLSPEARLRVTINDWTAFEGLIPSGPLTVSLTRFASQERLTIVLNTTPSTHFPRDPRELGVALRALRLEKAPQALP